MRTSAPGPDDGEPGKPGRDRRLEPERSCIVTRHKGDRDTLIRFALSPDGIVTPDIRAKLPGRGAWVTASAAVVADALKRKSFARTFKAAVHVPADLVDLVDALLERDALQALSIANKAGLVHAGMFKVEGVIGTQAPAAMVHAVEGGADGRRKLDAALRRRLGDAADQVPRVQIFRSDQLDLALGRTNVIHAALAAGSASEGFVARSQRLARFRTGYIRTEAPVQPKRSIDE